MRVRSQRGRMTRLLAVLLLTLPAASGCGEETGLSTTAIEHDIQQGLRRQTQIEISSVTCPAEVKLQKGAAFNCIATYAGGGKATIRVRQRDANGNVIWRLTGR